MNNREKEINVGRQVCDLCGTCVGICPRDALILTETELTVVYSRCNICGFCLSVCPLGALTWKR